MKGRIAGRDGFFHDWRIDRRGIKHRSDWEAGDPEYYALSEALQHLGNVAFRALVPAYKHSAAVFLNLIGRIPSDRTYPNNPRRPAWEAETMADCARRLSLLRACRAAGAVSSCWLRGLPALSGFADGFTPK